MNEQDKEKLCDLIMELADEAGRMSNKLKWNLNKFKADDDLAALKEAQKGLDNLLELSEDLESNFDELRGYTGFDGYG